MVYPEKRMSVFDENYHPVSLEEPPVQGVKFYHHKVRKNSSKKPLGISIAGFVFMLTVFIYAKQIDNLNPTLGKILRFVVILPGPKTVQYFREYWDNRD